MTHPDGMPDRLAPRADGTRPRSDVRAESSSEPREDSVRVTAVDGAPEPPLQHDTGSDGQLTPGADLASEPPLLPAGEQERLQREWERVQRGFIDDPRAAADAAAAVAADAVDAVSRGLQVRLKELDAWQDDVSGDTEMLRTVVRGYRDLITSLSGGARGALV